MKRFKILFAVATLALGIACQMTPQKAAVSTLTEVGNTGNSAYEAYLSLVVQGSLPTNDVPKITAIYRDFQVSFGVAASAAHFATNATLANPELLSTLNQLQNAILVIQQKGK